MAGIGKVQAVSAAAASPQRHGANRAGGWADSWGGVESGESACGTEVRSIFCAQMVPLLSKELGAHRFDKTGGIETAGGQERSQGGPMFNGPSVAGQFPNHHRLGGALGE